MDPTSIEQDDFSDLEPDRPEGVAPFVAPTPSTDPEAPIVVLASSSGLRTYRLAVPLTVNGEVLNEVRLRAATQGDIDDWGTGEIDSIRAFVCRLSGLHPVVVKAMVIADSTAVHQMFADMVPDFVTESDR